MLQSMRQGAQSTAAKIIIGLIVLSFAAFGLETLLPGGAGTSVAEINGEEISPFELQEAVTQQKRQLVSILGDNIDPAMLDDNQIKPRALDSLIQRTLLLQRSRALNLVASESQVGKSITEIDAFQLNGEFSADAYRSVLASAGYTQERFRRAQAEDILLTQLQRAISETEFTTATEQAASANVLAEERDVRYLVVAENELLAGEDLSNDALRRHYDENQASFFNPEQIVADYIELDLQDFVVSVDETLVRDQFEAVKSEYEVAEQARVSHILLIQGDDESDIDFAQRIDAVSDRLARDESFADVAAEMSDDLGSASTGGELGFTDGTAFPEKMEDAIARLRSPGEVSLPVETDAGTHFIRLEERVEGESVGYDSVKVELRASIEAAEAERELLIAVEELRDLVFNAADLTGPAEAIDAEVQRSAPFSVDEGAGLFDEARLREVAFTSDVKDAGNNSDVIELSGQRYVVLRVHEVRPTQVAPFAEVKQEVRAKLKAKAEAAALAEITERAEQMLSQGDSLEAAAQALGLEWRVELAATRLSSQLPSSVLEAAFTMRALNETALRPVPVPGTGYAIVQLARVSAGTIQRLNQVEQQQLRALRGSEQQRLAFDEFLLHQRDAADIVIR